MGRNYEELFRALPQEQLPTYLCERICLALERERERHARTRLVLSSLSGISSIAGLMFAIPALVRAASATGFTSYAPLLISDTDLISSHLGVFALSLLQAFPGVEVTVTLFLIAVLLVSIKNFVQGIVLAHLSFRASVIHFRI